MKNNILTTVKSEKQHRESNFELLRCIAMFLIVFCHLRTHGFKIVSYSDEPTISILLLKSFNWLGSLGNFLFMLITGYFISDNSVTPKKILKLWLQIFFYSVILGSVAYFNKLEVSSLASGYVFHTITLKEYLRSFIPFLSCHNWYSSAYLIFILLVPFLNICLNQLNQTTHLKLCLILVFLGGILANLHSLSGGFVPSRIFAFIMMFFIAKYLRLYSPKIFSNPVKDFLIAFGLCFSFCVYYILICKLSSRIAFIGNHKEDLLDFYAGKQTCLFVIVCSVFLFAGFKQIKIGYSRVINYIASCTFGIYLLHEDINTKYFMWMNIFKTDTIVNSKFLALYIICIIAIIFLAGMIIERIRVLAFEKPIFHILNKIEGENKK